MVCEGVKAVVKISLVLLSFGMFSLVNSSVAILLAGIFSENLPHAIKLFRPFQSDLLEKEVRQCIEQNDISTCIEKAGINWKFEATKT
jgi:hypothetical protein